MIFLLISSFTIAQQQNIIQNQSELSESQIADIKNSVIVLSEKLINEGYTPKICRQRANTYFVLKEYGKAIVDFTTIIENKTSDLGEVYYQRGLNYLLISDSINACKDFKKSKELGYSIQLENFELLCGG